MLSLPLLLIQIALRAYKLNNIYDQLILKRQPRNDDVT